jgi:hypothetical protein
MKRAIVVVAAIALAAGAFAADTQKLKANGSIQLTDPAGDAEPIHTSGDKDYPGLDVVKLLIKSDGKQITVAATLHEPPGEFASSAIEIDFDTDNNPKSGVTFTYPPVGGFEYVGKLDACADYADGSSACTGGSKAKAKTHWAAVSLARFTGKSQYDRDDVVDAMGFPGRKSSAKTPITGTVVQGAFDYADLHVKPGQTIRLLAKESHGGGADQGYFPEILLTLK